LREGAQEAKAYLERQDWRALIRIQEDPKAMLGVTGLVGALAIFIFFGGWKTRTINAQTVQIASQNSMSPVAVSDGSSSGYTILPAQNSLIPITSHQVDLGSSRAPSGDARSPGLGLPNDNLGTEPAMPSGIVKREKSPVPTDKRKAHSDSKNAIALQALATQPEVVTPALDPKSAAEESATNSSEPPAMPEPVFADANATIHPIIGGDETKTPSLYFEVAKFKDESWANNAVDKLTQLGFHAVLIHKNVLWSQSYHVEVGPYTNQNDIAAARQSLAAQGFKTHPVN
jgi:cell division septation protein DedD